MRLLSGRKNLLFDFDYTLGESTSGVIECVQYALGKLDLPPVSPANVRASIGLSLKQTFHTLARNSSESQSNEFTRLFIERGDEIMVSRTNLFPDTKRVLAILAQRQFKVAIVSTKLRRRIEAVFMRDGCRDNVEVIIGAEDVCEQKPSAEGANEAMQRMARRAEQCIFVGDSAEREPPVRRNHDRSHFRRQADSGRRDRGAR
jgi:phosphoglycolate phosphatase